MSTEQSFQEDSTIVQLDAVVTRDVSGAILRQEKRGQSAFVNSSTLPIKSCNTREQFEQAGIVFGENVDDLFVAVVLPDGWRKEATGHSMHSKLLDEKGRERASIFYKAAFYDRRANISLTCRFSTRVEPVCGYDDPNYSKSAWRWVVCDCGEIIQTSPDQLEPEPEYKLGDEDGRIAWLAWHDKKDQFARLGTSWLIAHYPNWKDPLAYWD